MTSEVKQERACAVLTQGTGWEVLRVLLAFNAWWSTDASNPLLGLFMHDVTQAIHFFCGCFQKRATTCSLEVGNLVLAAAKQIGPRCSQAFARLTDVRQAGLVSGGYPDSYLLDLGLLRCLSCEVVRSKGVRKIESAISKKRRKRTHLRDLGYIYILKNTAKLKVKACSPKQVCLIQFNILIAKDKQSNI